MTTLTAGNSALAHMAGGGKYFQLFFFYLTSIPADK